MASGTRLARISPFSLETFVSSRALLSFLALITRWSRQSRCSLCSGRVLGMKSPTKQRKKKQKKTTNYMHLPPSFLLPPPLTPSLSLSPPPPLPLTPSLSPPLPPPLPPPSLPLSTLHSPLQTSVLVIVQRQLCTHGWSCFSIRPIPTRGTHFTLHIIGR